MTTTRTTSTAYVTKYALTDGIWAVKAGGAEITDDARYLYVGRVGFMPIQVGEKDFFFSLDLAKARVKELTEAKIRSIEKQLKKLQNYNPAIKEIVS